MAGNSGNVARPTDGGERERHLSTPRRLWFLRRMIARRVNVPAWIILVVATVALVALVPLLARASATDIMIRSTGLSALVTVDGATHHIMWAAQPTRVIVAPPDLTPHDWAFDGSDTSAGAVGGSGVLAVSGGAATPSGADGAARVQSSPGNVSPLWAPYQTIQALLRGDAGYNERAAAWLSAPGHAAASVAPLQPVPPSFELHVTITRLERPTALLFTEVDGGTERLWLDRGDRLIRLARTVSDVSEQDRARWFFPHDPWPGAAIVARLVVLCAALAALLGCALVALGLLIPRRLAATLDTRGARRGDRLYHPLLVVILGLACAAALAVAIGVDQRMPLSIDGQAYLLQARIIASGQFTLPPPALGPYVPAPFFGIVRGRWLAQYAPGTALLLAGGLRLGVPWLVEPALAVATLALLAGIGRRLYGPGVGLLTALLGALSPFYLGLSGAYLSHIPTVFLATLAYALLLRSDWGRVPWRVGAAGLALGAAATCRELDAVVVGAPLTVALVARFAHHRTLRHAAALLAWAGAAGVGVAALAAYNVLTTGNIFLSPRAVLNPTDRYGFGPGHGWWGTHTLAAGLANLDQLLTGLAIVLNGWPFAVALAVPLAPFLFVRATRHDVLHGAIVLCVCAGTVGYYAPGVLDGPRYLAAATPFLFLLTARGLCILGEVAHAALAPVDAARARGHAAVALVLALLIAVDVAIYAPAHFAREQSIADMSNTSEVAATLASVPSGALVVTRSYRLYTTLLAGLDTPEALMNPADTRDTLWVLTPTKTDVQVLADTYPRRPVYVLSIHKRRLALTCRTEVR